MRERRERAREREKNRERGGTIAGLCEHASQQ